MTVDLHSVQALIDLFQRAFHATNRNGMFTWHLKRYVCHSNPWVLFQKTYWLSESLNATAYRLLLPYGCLKVIHHVKADWITIYSDNNSPIEFITIAKRQMLLQLINNNCGVAKVTQLNTIILVVRVTLPIEKEFYFGNCHHGKLMHNVYAGQAGDKRT